jgi:hypothetical protein
MGKEKEKEERGTDSELISDELNIGECHAEYVRHYYDGVFWGGGVWGMGKVCAYCRVC